MSSSTAPSALQRLRVPLAGLAGLLATPIVTYLLGWAIYGRRVSWSVDQGDSWIVFLMAVYAAPFGAAYWALVRWIGVRPLVAVPVYLVGLAVAVSVAIHRYG